MVSVKREAKLPDIIHPDSTIADMTGTRNNPIGEGEIYLKRKESAVLKDLETAFAGYQRLIVQVNSVRTWTVTLMSASLALVLTSQSATPLFIAMIALVAIFAFSLLELRERSSMAFNKAEVLVIEKILMEKDQAKYANLIDQYEFRDLRLVKITRKEKLGHLIASARNWTVIVWYGFWVLLLCLALFFRAAVED
jgi:hypothetical protein